LPKTCRATSHASAMSVAVGMPQPFAMDASPLSATHAKYTPMGPSTPPMVPSSGLMALRGGFSAPPGRQLSVISLAAMPKNSAMKMSLTRKCTLRWLPWPSGDQCTKAA
jgi:hypothetical protein